MVGWHHRLNGNKSEGDGEGQGSLVCCSPWSQRIRNDWANEQERCTNTMNGVKGVELRTAKTKAQWSKRHLGERKSQSPFKKLLTITNDLTFLLLIRSALFPFQRQRGWEGCWVTCSGLRAQWQALPCEQVWVTVLASISNHPCP